MFFQLNHAATNYHGTVEILDITRILFLAAFLFELYRLSKKYFLNKLYKAAIEKAHAERSSHEDAKRNLPSHVRRRFWMSRGLIASSWNPEWPRLIVGFVVVVLTMMDHIPSPFGWFLAAYLICKSLQWYFIGFRAYHNARLQRTDILYVWPYDTTRDKSSLFEKSPETTAREALADELGTLIHCVKWGLELWYDVVALAPPPRQDESELDADLRWMWAPYLFRPKADEEWRTAFVQLSKRCRAVVVQCPESEITENLKWELGVIAKRFPLHCILLVSDDEVSADSINLVRNELMLRRSDNEESRELTGSGRRMDDRCPVVIVREQPSNSNGNSLGSSWRFIKAVKRWAFEYIEASPQELRSRQRYAFKRKLFALPLHTVALGEILSLVGMVLAVLSCIINWY